MNKYIEDRINVIQSKFSKEIIANVILYWVVILVLFNVLNIFVEIDLFNYADLIGLLFATSPLIIMSTKQIIPKDVLNIIKLMSSTGRDGLSIKEIKTKMSEKKGYAPGKVEKIVKGLTDLYILTENRAIINKQSILVYKLWIFDIRKTDDND